MGEQGLAEVPGGSATAEDAAELMRREFACFAAGDVDGIVALSHANVVIEIVALDLVVHGRDALRATFAEIFGSIEDLAFEPQSIRDCGDGVAVGEWRLRGRFAGGTFQGIEPTGRRVELRGIDVMEWRDGQLVRNTIYYDATAFARQIGLLPPAGSRADRAMLAGFNALTRLKRRLARSR